MKKIIEEFKKFAFKGNVVDMAIGVIIGCAFGSIVNSLVSDIIMPLIGLLTGGLDFSSMQIVLKQAEDGTVENALKYGQFIQNIIYFFIVAISVFIAVKIIAKATSIANKKKIEAEKAAAEAKRLEEEEKKKNEVTPERLLTEIRDLLAAQSKTEG